LVLRVTEQLRREKVVGKFVEFFGEGTRSLSLPDRATIGNMSPEYGATMGFFPVDDKTLDYFRGTGRTKPEIEAFEAYFRAQGLFGVANAGDIDYSQVVSLDLGDVTPSLAGPKRPQDRIELGNVANQFTTLFSQSSAEDGFNQPAEMLNLRHTLGQASDAKPLASQNTAATTSANVSAAGFPTSAKAVAEAKKGQVNIGNGDVLIAAITSCTNTSNPSVLLAAGLLAKKAVLAGLKVQPHIKTSLAPGSRIVTEYLTETGLMPYLEKLGFSLAGYGCTTCIGNSGDLTPEINDAISDNDLICAAVLSGNRNFEARIHPYIKANFLASPPLVVAYAIAGTVMRDLMTEPVGQGKGGKDVYLGDIWPTSEEIQALMKFAMNGKAFRANYAKVKTEPGKLWEKIQGVTGTSYTWPVSTYIAEPPFFKDFEMACAATAAAAKGSTAERVNNDVIGARIMALFGDSITTDHISPAGSIQASSPAGSWLKEHGVLPADFNSYGSRRGNHEVMMRGTFANVRIKNLMLPAATNGSREEGGLTLFQPSGEKMFIYDAAMQYIAQNQGTVVFAGEEYGTGSSRDWAAKGTQLLGIKAVIARSFERIHRSNLVGMGVLPLQFKAGDSWETLGLKGDETIDVIVHPDLKPQSDAKLVIIKADGKRQEVALTLRVDTPIEVDYYRNGGILPYVLRQLLA
jgi:aconitate hydratase